MCTLHMICLPMESGREINHTMELTLTEKAKNECSLRGHVGSNMRTTADAKWHLESICCEYAKYKQVDLSNQTDKNNDWILINYELNRGT